MNMSKYKKLTDSEKISFLREYGNLLQKHVEVFQDFSTDQYWIRTCERYDRNSVGNIPKTENHKQSENNYD